MELDHRLHREAPSQTTTVFVRPHDLEVTTTRNGHPSFEARVARINSAGASVHLELVAASGEPLFAEVSHERFRTLALEAGSTAYVTPRTITHLRRRLLAVEARRHRLKRRSKNPDFPSPAFAPCCSYCV